MKLYRISREKHARDLSGTGARLYGGRWNSQGVAALYTAEHISLAKLEVAVHLSLDLVPDDYRLITLELPNAFRVKALSAIDLPNSWDKIPFTKISQQIGNTFLKENEFIALRIPSAIIHQEFNYILNPFHNDYPNVKILDIEDFKFDDRLLK